MLSPGITSTLSYAGNVQQTATLPEGSHALEVTLLTGNGTKANGFVWLKGQLGETVPVELVDGGALLSMTPGENYELNAMLAAADGTMVEWSQPFCFQPEDGIMWLYPNGLPYAVYPAESADVSERDLFCLLPDAPHNMEIRTEAADNLLKWDYKQFDSFVPVKYEVYHNDTLVGETLVRESVVSVLDGDNSYMVVAVDEYGERRYGEILTLTLENETTIAGNANSLDGMTDDADSKFSGIKDTGKVNVYITNEDGTALGLATRETHTRVPSETYYSKTKQLTFYYINNSDIFGREAADSAFIDFIHSAVCAKWGERRYCAKCGYSGTNLEHGYSDHDKTSWSHCFGLFNAPAVNHRHNTGPHTYLTAVDSGVPGGNSYRSAAAYTPTAESMKTNPTYWVMTEVHNIIVDIDVDSDNDGDLESNVKNYAVAEDRDEAKGFGQVFLSTEHDRNGNGKLDCFDNIEKVLLPSCELFLNKPSDFYIRSSYEQLIPMHTKIPRPPLISNDFPGTVTFTYNDSPPYGDGLIYVNIPLTDGSGTLRDELAHDCKSKNCEYGYHCQPPGGALRLWCEYNNQLLFIPSGATLNAPQARAASFYIEGVRASAQEQIRIDYRGRASTGIEMSQTITCSDVVNVTPFSVFWEPIFFNTSETKLINASGSISEEQSYFSVEVLPDSIPDSAIKWKPKGNTNPAIVSMTGKKPSFIFTTCGSYDLYIDVYDYFETNNLISEAPSMHHNVYSPIAVDAVYITAKPTVGFWDSDIVAKANRILSQAGYQLPELTSCVVNADFCENFQGQEPKVTNAFLTKYFSEKTKYLREKKYLKPSQLAIYVIDDIGTTDFEALGFKPENFIIIKRKASHQILAHEFFHTKGGIDLYAFESITKIPIRPAFFYPSDWGNGYYRPLMKLYDIDMRLIMNGEVNQPGLILPNEQVWGGMKGLFGSTIGPIADSQKDVR